ncbi:hypothetical protein MiSe_90830 [Microseira wollei NIES-4236]|uniref:Uncharacterized protein n=1 Tax=Microseira wollei NIES-4236 TaxID=2530354 RepID=A0AAV3XTL4_9CYAN|nr:hypothetical protein MiSe_90830 [Microseira wollei NIES-4236]
MILKLLLTYPVATRYFPGCYEPEHNITFLAPLHIRVEFVIPVCIMIQLHPIHLTDASATLFG